MAESRILLTFKKNDLPELDEIKLIKAARRDPRLFGELYKRYVERIYRYLFSRIGNVHDAEDATAQTFMAAFESFDRFRQDKQLAAWLFTIARNKAMDHFRRQARTPIVDENNDFPDENEPISDVIQSEQTLILSKLIQSLPTDDRELLRLRFLAELSFPEMAHLLHRKEEAVKKSTYRLLARLKSQAEVSNE